MDADTKPWYDAFSSIPDNEYTTVEVFDSTLLIAKQLTGANSYDVKAENLVITDSENFSIHAGDFDELSNEAENEKLEFKIPAEVLTNAWPDDSYSFTILENMLVQLSWSSSLSRVFVRIHGRQRHFQHPMPTQKIRRTLSGSFGPIDKNGNFLDEWRFRMAWSESESDSGLKKFSLNLGWKRSGGYSLSSVVGLRFLGKDTPR